MYNNTVKKFFDRNGIVPEKIMAILSCNNLSIREFNPIFEFYGMFKNPKLSGVSVGNILGYDYNSRLISSNIFESFNSFFDEYGDGYHNRSCPDLLKTPLEMLQSYSFIKEPMVLYNVDPNLGIYFVANNGLHRYTALKALYLKELSENPENIEEIKNKYTINAKVQEIDRLKTYCSFIIAKTVPDGWLKHEYDEDYNYTINSVFVEDNKTKILSDEELLEIVKQLYNNNLEIFSRYLEIEDFKRFVMEQLTMEEIHER